MKRILTIIALLATTTVSANQAHTMISAMSEDKRRNFFTNYMKQSGERCVVTKTFYQGKTGNGDVFWNVECSNKKAFSILIRNDSAGSSQILDCGTLKTVAKTNCFQAF